LPETFNFGEFLSRTIELMRENLRSVALYVLAIGSVAALGAAAGLSSADSNSFGVSMGFSVTFDEGLAGFLFQLAQAIFSFVAVYLLIASLLRENGRLRSSELRVLPYVGMSILATLGVVFGMLLLIVPGLILATRWTTAAGFLVAEGEGVTDSLSKSWQATSGHAWQIFFGGLVIILGFSVLMGIVITPVSIYAGSFSADIFAAFLNALSGAILSSYGIAVYLMLTSATGDLEDVFA
jgi:hypothetical protein